MAHRARWQDSPTDVLVKVACMTDQTGRLGMGAVCTSWRRVVREPSVAWERVDLSIRSCAAAAGAASLINGVGSSVSDLALRMETNNIFLQGCQDLQNQCDCMTVLGQLLAAIPSAAPALERLDLHHLKKDNGVKESPLQVVADGLGQLTKLQHLSLATSTYPYPRQFETDFTLVLPDSVSLLTALQSLHVLGCGTKGIICWVTCLRCQP